MNIYSWLISLEILKILLRDENLGEDVDLKALSIKTESFSGSDLKCLSYVLNLIW